MERETGFEPATSSLGIRTYFESKSLARFCCEFLNLQRLAESAFSSFDRPIEAQTRHVLFYSLDASRPPRSHEGTLAGVALTTNITRLNPYAVVTSRAELRASMS